MFTPPMLLDVRSEPFNDPDFLFEPKGNGVRLLYDYTDSDKVLYTRHSNDITSRLPEIERLEIDKGTLLDGEIVCYYPEDHLKEDFEAVMKRINTTKRTEIVARSNPITYIVFDILKHRGKSVMNMPLLERKQLLDEVIVNQPHLNKLFYIQEKGIELFEKIKQFELEGMVAKSKDSRYYSTDGHVSVRPKDVWVKIINWRYDICYIVGYRKNKSGWYIAIPTVENKFKNVGLMEFGASPDHKIAFYQIAKTIITKEMNDIVWIKPLIRCNVKHRGVLRSGNFMTPIFVEFIF